MTSPPGALTPALVLDLSWGLARTATLVTALDLDVFTHVAGGKDRPADVAEAVGASEPAVCSLMFALAGIGLLELVGDDRYALTPVASSYLVHGEPRYLGDLRHLHHGLNFRIWPSLTEAICSGCPSTELFADDATDVWKEVLPYLEVLGRPNAAWIAGLVADRLPAEPRLLDVGCGSGVYSQVLASRLRGAVVVGLDRPELAALAGRGARSAGIGDHTEFRGGDVRDLPFGTGFDMVLFSNLLHGYGSEECRKLLVKARRALKPGGLVVVHEFVPDGEHPTENPIAALFGLEMMLTSGGGAHDEESYRGWLAAAGLTPQEVTRSPVGPTTVIVATADGDRADGGDGALCEE